MVDFFAGGSSGGRKLRGFVVGFAEEGKSWAPGKGCPPVVWMPERRRLGEDAPLPIRTVTWDCGIPRAEARLVASEDVDFCSRGGMGVLPVFANGSEGCCGVEVASLLECFPFVDELVGMSSFSLIPSVDPLASITVSKPPNAVTSFSTGRSASRLRFAAQRWCSVESSSSVRRASGSLVSFAAEAKDVEARECEEAAARRVEGL